MRLTSHRNLMRSAQRHPGSIAAVQRWYDLILETEARSLQQLRRTFPSADQVRRTLVFNIGGNNFRLVCCVDWNRQRLFFRELLTHAEYDRVKLEDLCP